MYDELPIAGPYPAPGITRQSTEQFRQRLIDLKVDAVIAGNGQRSNRPQRGIYIQRNTYQDGSSDFRTRLRR